MKLPVRVEQVLTVVIGSLVYAYVSFYRTSPSVLINEFAGQMNVSPDKVSVFSSMFYWPYAIMQPLAGLLCDIFDPGLMIGVFLFLASGCSIATVFSSNYVGSCTARCLVGLCCGPVYVPLARAVAGKFSPRWFNIWNSVILSMGSVGGILGQGPLASLVEVAGNWRLVYSIVSGIAGVLAILAGVFIRVERKSEELRCGLFGKNLLTAAKNKSFWKLALWGATGPSSFFSVSGFWGVAYSVAVFGINKEKAGYVVMMLSIAWIVGAPVLASLSEALKTRKWIIFGGAVLSAVVCFGFMGIDGDSPEWLLWMMLFAYGVSTSAVVAIGVTSYKEMSDPSVVGLTMGMANLFPFVMASILQNINTVVMKAIDGGETDVHSTKAYKLGLWLVNGVSCTISILGPLMVKETFQKTPDEPESNERETELINDSDV